MPTSLPQSGMLNHVVPRLGRKRMDSIEREDLVELFAELMAKAELSPRSILAIYGDLRVLWKWAVDKDKVAHSVVIVSIL